MRIVVFTVALVFIAGLGVLTVMDIVKNGVTPIGIVAVLLLVVIMVGVVGALAQPPRQ